MASDYPAPQGLIELVERKYDLKVIDSHYILVDAQFQQYSIMLDVQFNEKMNTAFQKLYKNQDEANGVSWDICPKTNSIRFLAEIGNNILLLWDNIKNASEDNTNTNKDIFSPEYYIKLNKQSAKIHKVYDDSENKNL